MMLSFRKPPVNPFDPFRYPDKPRRVSRDFVARLGPGFWAQPKVNGFRTALHVWPDKSVRAYSRQNMRLSRVLRRDDDFEPELMEVIYKLDLPVCGLDCEWIGRRDVDNVEHEWLYVFDVTHLDCGFVGELTLAARSQIMEGIFAPRQAILNEQSDRVCFPRPHEGLPYLEVYDSNRGTALCEGIVLKHLGSGLVGDVRESAQNPHWLKLRYEDEILEERNG